MLIRTPTFIVLKYIFTSLSAIIYVWSDLPNVRERSWFGWNPGMFGMNALPDFFVNFLFDKSEAFYSSIVGLSLLFLMSLIFYYRYPNSSVLNCNETKSFSERKRILLLFSVLNIAIYVGPSYDLRLYIFLPVFFLLLNQQKQLRNRVTLHILFFSIFYLTGQLPFYLNVLGDTALFLLVTVLLSSLIRYLHLELRFVLGAKP
jgi:hypothetical protein